VRAGCSIWANNDKGLTTQNSAHGSLAQIHNNPCYVRFIDISLIPSSIGGFPRYSPCKHKAIIHLVTCVNTKGTDGLQETLPVTFGNSLIVITVGFCVHNHMFVPTTTPLCSFFPVNYGIRIRIENVSLNLISHSISREFSMHGMPRSRYLRSPHPAIKQFVRPCLKSSCTVCR